MALLATDNDDIRDRDIWTGVARYWYLKATDKTPHIGRRFHRLASLAGPNVLQRLFYYCKSLAVTAPFYPARESILTFFHTIFSPEHGTGNHNIDAGFIQLHGINFTHIGLEKFDDDLSDYLDRLAQNIGERKSDWKPHVKGKADKSQRRIWRLHLQQRLTKTCCQIGGDSRYPSKEILSFSKRLVYDILSAALQRIGDSNVLPHIHIWLAFLAHVVKLESAMRLLENEFPWEHLVSMLNSLVEKSNQARFGCKDSPVPEEDRRRPLPEDYTLRNYFPGRWFEDAQLDEEERSVEVPSTENVRIERILWLTTEVATEMGSDIDMTSGEDDYVHVGLSEEVRRLKKQQRQLNSQLKACGKALDSAEEAKQAVAKGPESLKENLSVLVVDTNILLLSQPEIFKLMVSTPNWSIVIPNAVITELLGLTNSTGPVGDSTKAAMVAIHEALTEEKNVKIVIAKGSNMTNMGFYREQLDEGQGRIDDIII
ncbi:hypothetical protein L873DRAFT_1793213 [Choiromyces venosus 120613-1]|uniref:PIN domain-containing protein n=1 Tax=Choiromyces venosus 120613-1 TaxID=1336337 RepID=A0A3N4JJN6_9PEZI|nr:hypothetical protein L873DRAFT_1793213 [Choiromyces venosus 120613-1]